MNFVLSYSSLYPVIGSSLSFLILIDNILFKSSPERLIVTQSPYETVYEDIIGTE